MKDQSAWAGESSVELSLESHFKPPTLVVGIQLAKSVFHVLFFVFSSDFMDISGYNVYLTKTWWGLAVWTSNRPWGPNSPEHLHIFSSPANVPNSAFIPLTVCPLSLVVWTLVSYKTFSWFGEFLAIFVSCFQLTAVLQLHFLPSALFPKSWKQQKFLLRLLRCIFFSLKYKLLWFTCVTGLVGLSQAFITCSLTVGFHWTIWSISGP